MSDLDPDKELDELFDELDQLLKNADVADVLASRGVNTSLALVAADGLRAYLQGKKRQAAEDFETVAEEIATRLARGGGGDGSGGAGDGSEQPS